MGHSQLEKAQSRERILDAAATQVREGGFDSVSISELMRAAQLTHGAFYGHFPSRADLIAAALDRALELGEAEYHARPTQDGAGSVKAIVNPYLSPAHRDRTGGGCAIAALAADVARSDDPKVRALMSQRAEIAFKHMSDAFGGGLEAENAALAAWSTMVGALVLSRVFRGTAQSDAILKQARRSILSLERQVREGRNADG
ncbi:TetR/AcrR family transcriptional regulator [Phenylobacterium sp.]|uniref:TetR/AcrR family transcriptional regulator n=1 Tax=Phenylobacterium sp. TaxID=1871053 RepID=UPI0035B34BF2